MPLSRRISRSPLPEFLGDAIDTFLANADTTAKCKLAGLLSRLAAKCAIERLWHLRITHRTVWPVDIGRVVEFHAEFHRGIVEPRDRGEGHDNFFRHATEEQHDR